MRMEVGAFRREPSVVARGLRAGFFLKFSWQLRKKRASPFIVCGEGFRRSAERGSCVSREEGFGMKKLIVAACAFCLVACLAGCGGSQGAEPSGKSGQAGANSSIDVSSASVDVADAPSADGVTPEFKELMDSYEAFFDEYIAFMKKYESSSDPTSMLADFATYMNRYAETMQALNEVDQSSLSVADAAYYAEVSARIMEKTIELA